MYKRQIGAGGKITAGGLTITPTGELQSPTNLVVTAPALVVSGVVQGSGFTAPAITTTTGVSPNVYIDSLGRLRKIV